MNKNGAFERYSCVRMATESRERALGSMTLSRCLLSAVGAMQFYSNPHDMDGFAHVEEGCGFRQVGGPRIPRRNLVVVVQPDLTFCRVTHRQTFMCSNPTDISIHPE